MKEPKAKLVVRGLSDQSKVYDVAISDGYETVTVHAANETEADKLLLALRVAGVPTFYGPTPTRTLTDDERMIHDLVMILLDRDISLVDRAGTLINAMAKSTNVAVNTSRIIKKLQDNTVTEENQENEKSS